MSDTELNVNKEFTDSDIDIDMASSSHCADQDRDGDTDSVKVETEDTKPTVPSLLDLSFTPKEEEQTNSSEKNNGNTESESVTEEPTEIPFKLKKKHLFTACRLHYSLKSVIVKPFSAELFTSTTVQWWLKKACEFSIRSSWNGTSAGVFMFKTYSEALSAIKEIKTYVLGNVDSEVEVRYSLIKPDLPYRYPQDEVNYLLRDCIEQPLFSRVLVLEGIPEDTTEDDLMGFFPEAKSIMLLSHDEEYNGFGLVEFAANHKLREALNDYKKDGKDYGSVIEIKGQEVMIGKFMSRYNQAVSWLRSHPPKADTSVELSDEERIELCEELRDLLKERDILLDNEDNSTDDKIRSYWRLSEKMETLAKKLKHDTERRKQAGKKFPESKDLKISLVTILGQQDEEDEEITAATGKVPSLLDINPYISGGGPNTLLGKRMGSSLLGPMSKIPANDMSNWGASNYGDETMEINNTTDMLTKSMYDVSSGQGCSANSIQGLADTIQKATQVLDTMKRNPKNILSGPLETTRWCKIPLPFKKSLVSRSSTVKERLYITAYPRKFEDRVLEDILCRFGGLIDAYFSKGSNYGYAKFSDRTAAQNAIVILNDQVVAGSRLQLRKAESPGDNYSTRYSRRSGRE